MKNDLTTFEKNLLRAINSQHGTEYTHKNFMEWSNSKKAIAEKLGDDEKMYCVGAYFIAVKL